MTEEGSQSEDKSNLQLLEKIRLEADILKTRFAELYQEEISAYDIVTKAKLKNRQLTEDFDKLKRQHDSLELDLAHVQEQNDFYKQELERVENKLKQSACIDIPKQITE